MSGMENLNVRKGEMAGMTGGMSEKKGIVAVVFRSFLLCSLS